MAAFINRNSDWACIYFAGLLTDIASTLPEDDPWRHLSAMIDLDQVAFGRTGTDPDEKLVWKGEAPVPELTGAAIKAPGGPARAFGTSFDAQDLYDVDVADVRTAPQSVAVASNLSPLSASLVAMASADSRTMQVVLAKTYDALWKARFGSLTNDSPGESLLKVAGQAVQWLTHRRRSYLADEDGFIYTIGLAWTGKADRVNTGKSITSESRSYVDWKIPASWREYAIEPYEN